MKISPLTEVLPSEEEFDFHELQPNAYEINDRISTPKQNVNLEVKFKVETKDINDIKLYNAHFFVFR